MLDVTWIVGWQSPSFTVPCFSKPQVRGVALYPTNINMPTRNGVVWARYTKPFGPVSFPRIISHISNTIVADLCCAQFPIHVLKLSVSQLLEIVLRLWVQVKFYFSPVRSFRTPPLTASSSPAKVGGPYRLFRLTLVTHLIEHIFAPKSIFPSPPCECV
jgi:hypothetical protein